MMVAIWQLQSSGAFQVCIVFINPLLTANFNNSLLEWYRIWFTEVPSYSSFAYHVVLYSSLRFHIAIKLRAKPRHWFYAPGFLEGLKLAPVLERCLCAIPYITDECPHFTFGWLTVSIITPFWVPVGKPPPTFILSHFIITMFSTKNLNV